MARSEALYFRNFIFGVEDSLVSTVGLLSGIAIGGVPKETIILTGVVLILVEGFSMAAGSFLAESSAQEYTDKVIEKEQPFLGGVVMFVSYIIAGLIPLASYIFVDVSSALYLSVIVSLIALFVLGLVSGSLSNGNMIRHAFRMLIIGGIAVTAGVVAGSILSV